MAVHDHIAASTSGKARKTPVICSSEDRADPSWPNELLADGPPFNFLYQVGVVYTKDSSRGHPRSTPDWLPRGMRSEETVLACRIKYMVPDDGTASIYLLIIDERERGMIRWWVGLTEHCPLPMSMTRTLRQTAAARKLRT